MSTSNNMGRTTQAQPKPGVNVCIVKKEITNKFNEIITNALAEQLVVLNKRKKDLYRWEETEKKEFLDIFGRNEIEANKWLLRGVEAMILVNQRVKSNCFKYQGDECIFAKVQGGISSENPVIVGPKFFHAAVKGYDSQVSTLCHEFSHLSEVLYTDDLSPPGKNAETTSAEEYREHAENLVKTKSRDVMINGYNIERYFE
ncbi:peptidase M35 [Escherichia coli]|uniref:peptidase M35 n=1 Tax=Escherichia coli TaxID=562 RepID=UPI00073356AF|nr:peptidase M35 [Escherichia coli]PNP64531.1 peptidase M35 [Escherichia coli]